MGDAVVPGNFAVGRGSTQVLVQGSIVIVIIILHFILGTRREIVLNSFESVSGMNKLTVL